MPIDENSDSRYFDAIIIGAGISGLYQLLVLRRLGLRVRGFEAGTGVGGTWYWNRYPGARFDSESYSYGYSFSDELLEEWDWSEHFAPQPETERYLNYVADKFDLRKDIQFSSRVSKAHYQDADKAWRVTLESGDSYHARYLITAVGPLSAPTMPRIDGVEDYRGEAVHTGLWPKEPVTFENRRVGIIGTGATAVQTIGVIGSIVGHLTVFQRTPNWCAPLHNGLISDDEQRSIKAGYPEMFARCRETNACFLHTPDPRKTFDVSKQERDEILERLYATRGFGIWQGNFSDMLTDRKANAYISEFVANKIRQRVHDPVMADKLIPKSHGFGTRRVPLETHYYEVYNQSNVELIDINETPIERITERGVKTSDREFEFDLLIYATGFDAITGSLDRIDIRGANGVPLKDHWQQEGLKTFLGVMVEHMPNMFMLVGPHTALGNIPRSIEYSVEWVRDFIAHMEATEYREASVRPEAVDVWTENVRQLGEGLLSNEIDSWMTGVNRNVEGKQQRILARYSGSAPAYRAWCERVAGNGYQEINLS